MYQRKSRLSGRQQNRLVEHFVVGPPARAAAELVGVNRNTAVSFYNRLRMIIAEELTKASPVSGAIEVDESYFGGRRKGKRGRGAAGKVPVFGILKRRRRVSTQVIPDAKAKTLMGIMQDRIVPDSIGYTDTYRSYNVLDVFEFKHYRINHSKGFVKKRKHINGIENFWNQAKRHLRRFNGIPTSHFPLFLKECEWRFNTPNPRTQLYQLKRWAKRYLV